MSETDSNPAQNSAAHGVWPDVSRGTRCPICFWALYDWCQGPKWCANRGKSVKKPIRLTNAEAMEMIRHYCPTCGRHVPCRHCGPNAHVDLPDTAAQGFTSKSNNPAVYG